MTDAFGAVDLIVLPGALGGSQDAVYSERVIPGGTDTYIDVAGSQARRVSLPLFATTFDGFDGLRALVGTTAALTYATGGGAGVSITLALLTRLTEPQAAPLGQVWATAEFLVVTP